jgi:hypothetical protein
MIDLLEMDSKLTVFMDEEVDFLMTLSRQGKMMRFSEGVIE